MRYSKKIRRWNSPTLIAGILACSAMLILQQSHPMARGAGAVGDKADFWAFKPLGHPTPPHAGDAHYENPVDAFIQKTLAAKGMKPSPPADRRTLLRRVYFDLIGLPPTPEEMKAFLADQTPDAYGKVVDRLLASPRYGERWARHWMDVIHFAETHGNDQDRERPNAWPYRDYLVRSFNEDKPYARFVEEQVAGDVLFPDDPDATVALGFIAAGPWDESSLRDIRDDSIDKKIAQYIDRDDMVQTTFGTFDSVTVGCARCHNHKFDPILQADYYGLQADFAGVDRAERAYDSDPLIHRRRQGLLRERRKLTSEKYADIASLTAYGDLAQIERDELAWEKTVVSTEKTWTTLDPQTFTSSGGATLTKLPDHSILASGVRPDKDTYQVIASTDLVGMTAVRIELLTDASLPHKGPGRQDNGNLHLNEFYLKIAPRDEPCHVESCKIARARSDFDQAGWTIAMSIDRKPQTAWGIYPEIGKPHTGVYELKTPVGFKNGSVLTFQLDQTHGQGHLIGRLRLSATTSPLPAPVDVKMLPPAIAAILATPPQQRTSEAKLAIAVFYLQQKFEDELRALPPPQYVYAACNDFKPVNSFKPTPVPRAVFVLHRGDINLPGDAAVPGALACVPGLPGRFSIADPTDESARRAALARWLASSKNTLTWRSIANRVWQYHFGKGIVATPNDFGHMGAPPTHPELLDWLANWLLDRGGSLKQLHRLLVTSQTYRQSSAWNEQYARIDGGNQYLWRMEPTRLDAESVRDTVLQVSGLLDTTMGGPSAKQFNEKPGVQVTPVLDYAGFDPDNPAERRLSIYRFIYRTVPDPFMDAMDCPDASQFAPVRGTSLTALQALAMLNDRFMVRYSEHLAERVARERADLPGQLSRVYQLCLDRNPTAEESAEMASYANKHGMANLCRIVLNSNEFLFVN